METATTRGVSSALYYIFTYMFLVIGSFGVITVMARDGDTGHQISDYRGLARRQPLLALAFAVLLLGQAGIPFTTGFLAKFGVVGAAVDTHAYGLAVVAMVSAAVAAFFYLRVAITMFSPVGEIADSATTPHPADGYTAGDGDDPHAGRAMPAGLSADGDSGDRGDAVSSLLVLTDAPPGRVGAAAGGRAGSRPHRARRGHLGGLHRGVRDHPRTDPRLRPPGHPALLLKRLCC